jgi:outer membrane lipoprotein-sorting protein
MILRMRSPAAGGAMLLLLGAFSFFEETKESIQAMMGFIKNIYKFSYTAQQADEGHHKHSGYRVFALIACVQSGKLFKVYTRASTLVYNDSSL